MGRRRWTLPPVVAAALLAAGPAGAGGGPPPDSAALAAFSAALAAPCSTAALLYQKLSFDTGLPDSLRAEACCRRADLAFALREYETARDYYKRASLFDGEGDRYRYRWALSALANGDTAECTGILAVLAGKNAGTVTREAETLLGWLALQRGEYAPALELFHKTGAFSPMNGWSVRAFLGKLACAKHLGLADSAKRYECLLAPYEKTMLEKEEFKRIREFPVAKPVLPDTASRTDAGSGRSAGSGGGFSLQVGAFGSEANARALKKKLEDEYDDVACVTAIVSERTFYRVLVGSFASREVAERFGREILTPAGIVYRVVAQQ